MRDAGLFTFDVEVTGTRMTGRVPVRFGRNGSLEPEIRFGHGRYRVEEPDLWLNGVPYTVASFKVTCSDKVWHGTGNCYSIRRCDTERLRDSHPTPSALRTFTEWAVTTATRLAEQHPTEFDRRPLFSVRDTALEEMRIAFRQLELLIVAETRLNDVDNVRYDTSVDVEEISWTINNNAAHLAGPQGKRSRGRVIAIGYHRDEPVGYIVSGDSAPLVIPFELVCPKP